MKLFLIKIVFLASLMFLTVLIGMQQANVGIQKMKGYEDPKFRSALTLQASDSGDLHASVLGVDVSSHDFEKKKQQLEGIKAYNLFSEIGKKISHTLRSLINSILGQL
ncbi:DUF3679 domain-containing protein [Pseudoneobacillus sp. C159]